MKLVADLHHLLLATIYLLIYEVEIVIFLSLQTRKFKELLERNLGWEFQQGSAVDGIYFEENDEVSICVYLSCFATCNTFVHRPYWFTLQYAPVVEMLDDEAQVVLKCGLYHHWGTKPQLSRIPLCMAFGQRTLTGILPFPHIVQ